ncbi:unnamed protein product [Cuscuta europaea]|uniref:Uncharacterized protein n=1 Tax=Cuscuta europaea TaxID=41803 RepID=A0A9P1EMH1_CUSEU|nr:unnamed protein product [Cuscuta europaea]
MAVDQPFEDLHSNPLFYECPGSFDAANAGAGQASVSKAVEPISLEDPIHAIMKQGGCHPSRLWSTSAIMNDYHLPRLSVEQAETGVALATLKVGYYTVQLQLARLEREEELIRARLSVEQATVEVLQAADQEQKKFEAGLRQL